MKTSTFFRKIFSPMLWLNLLAMACVTVALCFGVKYGIDFYTHHGVINASSTPTLTIPDVIDNSSYREARTKLEAMGFKVGEPQYVNGEKDWVYGIKVKDKLVGNGQKVSIDALLIIQVGDGLRGLDDSVNYTTGGRL